MSKKNSLLVLILGSLGGIVTTLFFAKHKGADVRKRFSEKKKAGESTGGVVLEELGAMKDEIVKVSKSFLASKDVQDMMEQGKKKIHEFYDEAKEKGEGMMKEAQTQLLEYSKIAQEKAAALGEEMKRRGHLAWDELREDAKEITDDAQTKASKKVDEVKERFGAKKK